MEIISDFLFNNVFETSPSKLTYEEQMKRRMITVNRLDIILKDPMIPKTVGERLNTLLLYL